MLKILQKRQLRFELGFDKFIEDAYFYLKKKLFPEKRQSKSENWERSLTCITTLKLYIYSSRTFTYNYEL